jgi:hypothetical protein
MNRCRLGKAWVLCAQADTVCHIIQKYPVKQEGAGTEFKSLADVDTGCLLRLEIMEGRVRNQSKAYEDLGLCTAVSLRLTEPFHHSNWVLARDSAFSSVKTAIELKKRGLFYDGCVKTAHKEFPKHCLNI